MLTFCGDCARSCCDLLCWPFNYHETEEYKNLLVNVDDLPREIDMLSCGEVRSGWLTLNKHYGMRGCYCYYSDCNYRFVRPCFAWAVPTMSIALGVFVSAIGIICAINPDSFSNYSTTGNLAIDYTGAAIFGGLSLLCLGPCAIRTYLLTCQKINQTITAKKCFASCLGYSSAFLPCTALFLACSIVLLYGGIHCTLYSCKGDPAGDATTAIYSLLSLAGLIASAASCYGCYFVIPECAQTYKRMKMDIRVGTRHVNGSRLGECLFDWTCLVDPTCSSCYPRCLLPPKKEDPKLIEV